MYLLMITFLYTYQISVSLATEPEQIPKPKEIVAQLVKEDLEGKLTCFQGEIKQFSNFLAENYGGRFSGNYDLYVTPINSSVYRYHDKYCSEDQNGQQICESADEENYLVTINFSASTSGTREIESIVFVFTVSTTNRLVLNTADLEVLDHKITVNHDCQRLILAVPSIETLKK